MFISSLGLLLKTPNSTTKYVDGVPREILSHGDNLCAVPCQLGGARKRFNQKGKSVAKKRHLNPKKGRVDDWARVILRILIIPALFHHNFGGDAQGVLGACPFDTLHQYQLGGSQVHFLFTLQLLTYPRLLPQLDQQARQPQ